MYISTSKSKNATIYYVCKSFRKDGATSSKRIETLGTIASTASTLYAPISKTKMPLRFDMNYLHVRGEGYMPVFEGNDITTAIADIVSPSLQNQIITTRNMKAIIKSCVKVS